MKRRITGIRNMLMRYLIIVGALCSIVTILSSVLVSLNLSSTGVMFVCNKNLSEFYDNAKAMDTGARAFVYSRSEKDYNTYISGLNAATKNLDRLAENVDEDTAWRFRRLNHMLEYYREPFDQYGAGELSAYESYNLLYYRHNLIARTATAYYNSLSAYMDRENVHLQRIWQHQRNFQFVMLVFVMALAIAMGMIYTKDICAPVKQMVGNTQRIKRGQYQLEAVNTRIQELDILASSFQEMTASVEKSIDALKEKAELEYALVKQENENLAMQNLVTQAELHSLQAQINPHFIFNTLSMISKSAYISGDTTTSTLMDKLSEFLRYALGKANKSSTLMEELESIKNYIFIQQKRFSDRIRFEVEVDENLPNIAMPAVVLQPLIENAVLHGALSMTEDVLIQVSVYRWRDKLRIQVEDNGSGMAPEDLEELLSKLKLGIDSSPGNNGHGIGLSNVYKRLEMFYGPEMNFTMQSEAGCGTIVLITLPVEEN